MLRDCALSAERGACLGLDVSDFTVTLDEQGHKSFVGGLA
jgi:hypothetical protein